MNVKSPNNISKWQMGFNSAFKGLIALKYAIYNMMCRKRLRWSRSSVLAFGTQVRGFTPGRSRRIFRTKKSSTRLPSEEK
jgi:hypothetical protein